MATALTSAPGSDDALLARRATVPNNSGRVNVRKRIERRTGNDGGVGGGTRSSPRRPRLGTMRSSGRRRTAAAAAAVTGVGATILLLVSQTPPPTRDPLDPIDSEHPARALLQQGGRALTDADIEELGEVLGSDFQLSKACVTSLVRAAETYHRLPRSKGSGKASSSGRKGEATGGRHLPVTPSLPACTSVMSEDEQRRALETVAALIRYQGAAHGHGTNLATLALMAFALALPLAMLTHSAVVPRLFRTARDPCSCRLCRGQLQRGQTIGEGGFAKAVLVHDLAVGTKYVAKMIRVDLAKGVNDAQDALEEAKALLSLRHVNIVEYFDVFLHREEKAESGSDEVEDHVVILMEWCGGGTLLDCMGPELRLSDVVRYMGQCARGLAHMHARGTLHRDIKPENIFLRTDGMAAKIGDLGLAIACTGAGDSANARGRGMSGGRRSRGRSRSGLIGGIDGPAACGTTEFMSPECFNETIVDAASDVWSLAVTMYELVTGRTDHSAGLVGSGTDDEYRSGRAGGNSDGDDDSRGDRDEQDSSDNDEDSEAWEESEELALCEVALARSDAWASNLDRLVARFAAAIEMRGALESREAVDRAARVLPPLLRLALSIDRHNRPTARRLASALGDLEKSLDKRV